MQNFPSPTYSALRARFDWRKFELALPANVTIPVVKEGLRETYPFTKGV